MKTAIVSFQGFTQDLGSSSGTERLWQKIRDFAGPEVTVLPPASWDSRTDRTAAFLKRQRIEQVIIVGYSWGGGYASQRFASQCAEWGIRVPLMLLCDPVYRPLWLPPFVGLLPLAFRAMMPGAASIKIPRNVHRVAWVRQTKSLPMGHPIEADIYTTSVENAILLDDSHVDIDDAPEWHDLVVSKITKFLKPSDQ